MRTINIQEQNTVSAGLKMSYVTKHIPTLSVSTTSINGAIGGSVFGTGIYVGELFAQAYAPAVTASVSCSPIIGYAFLGYTVANTIFNKSN